MSKNINTNDTAIPFDEEACKVKIADAWKKVDDGLYLEVEGHELFVDGTFDHMNIIRDLRHNSGNRIIPATAAQEPYFPENRALVGA